MSVRFFQPQASRIYNPPEKYSKTYDADTYIFHISNIYKRPEKVATDSKIKQLHVWKIFTGKWTSGIFEFGHFEYMMAAFNSDFTLFHLIHFIDIMRLAGGAGVIVYLMLMIVIPLPLSYLYTFIAMYSRCGYMRFWNSLPMAKGFGYSVVIYNTWGVIMHVPINGLCLWTIAKVMFRGPFNSGKPHNTVIMTRRALGCPELLPNKSAYGSLIHVEKMLMFNTTVKFGNFAYDWWTAAIFSWIILFITLLQGFKKIYKIMHKISTGLVILLCTPAVLVTIYISRSYLFYIYGFTTLGYTMLWVRLGAFLLEPILPSTYMTFASLSKPGLNPQAPVLFVYFMKASLYAIATISTSIIHEHMDWLYSGRTECFIRFSGFQVVLGLLPEWIAQSPFGDYGVILYFCLLFYWSLSTITYTLHGTIETIFLTFPNLTIYRLFISMGILAVAVVTTTILFVTNLYYTIYVAWYEDAIYLYIYFMLGVIAISILVYSIKRFNSDYYFEYSKHLHPFAKFGIQLSLMYCLVSIFLHYIYGFRNMRFSITIYMLTYIFALIIVSPLFIHVCITLYQDRQQRLLDLLKPTAEWGPANADRRPCRRRYDPSREFSYRIDLPCSHMCLTDSKCWKSEREFWRTRFEYLTSLQKEYGEKKSEVQRKKTVAIADEPTFSIISGVRSLYEL